MPSSSLLQQILDPAARADPYPLYRELRKTPVHRDESTGIHAVSTYWEIRTLLQDPRISSDARNLAPGARSLLAPEEDATLPPTMIRLDPPEHDRLRRLAMRPFGPPHSPRRVHEMRGELSGVISGLVDALAGHNEADLVDEVAYPFPVAVICKLLGVPREDEPRFRVLVDAIVAGIATGGDTAEQQRTAQRSRMELAEYLAGLVEEHRRDPGEDMLSALVTDEGREGRMSLVELISNAVLLLVAGHETTVNLIANGVLTLLRNPEALERLRTTPSSAIATVEELLRFEPPVQLLPQRTTLADIEIAGTVIPAGAPVWLMLAAGNRDPQRFRDPDRFDPQREDIQHLGFGFGVHSCFGAPLARMEGQLALYEIASRLENLRLVEDPPPYRPSPVLRGPRHLPVAFDRVAEHVPLPEASAAVHG
ncbi:cytochrome P450 [Peterkaempfera sp. SMS 1(5)a]|uniref:cytochrome P450 n=1 Tax=Peterkaempfera podocarpi TaxID=3232308 RepID=UPI00366E140C